MSKKNKKENVGNCNITINYDYYSVVYMRTGDKVTTSCNI